MNRARQQRAKGALDLIEEATHLLRSAPAATLAAYYVGAVPFVLGLLCFWSDMSRNPFAEQHLAEAALGLALLFAWMKFCQAIFSIRLRDQIAGEIPRRWNFRSAFRMICVQTGMQPFGLLLFASLWFAFHIFFLFGVVMIPVVIWLLSFLQCATAVAGSGPDGFRDFFGKALRQWLLWTKQNLIILAILSGFGFFVFLNWSVVCLSLPNLIKMLFGIESVFTRSPLSMLNATFFAVMFGLTYLSVDPLVRAVYTLRCFYGASLQTGGDLKAELKRFALSARQAAAGLAILIALGSVSPAKGAEALPSSSSSSGIAAAQLDRSINEVIHERKYTWRMPHDKAADEPQGVFGQFSEKIFKLAQRCERAIRDWLDELFRRLFGRSGGSAASGSGYGWIESLQILLYALVVIAVVALGFLLYRVLRNRRESTTIKTEAIHPVPDVADENVAADQLPEDGWTRLARELLERGEFRLALRAFYLASLTHLAQRNLISIARFKSNRDYERELGRRGHSLPELLSAFGANVSAFDRIWYGMHEVSRDLVNQFAANVERIRSAG